MSTSKKCIYGIGALATALLSAPAFAATNFVRTDLISDRDGVAAVTDPNLVGTWGISVSAGSPFWVSNAGNGTSTADGNGALGATVLRAYDATNLATTLYSSATLAADVGGNAVKFTVPVVANGHVYVAGAGALTVYGLAP